MTADDVHNVYEMTRKEHATHLKRTVDEMLELGFEGSMLKAYESFSFPKMSLITDKRNTM